MDAVGSCKYEISWSCNFASSKAIYFGETQEATSDTKEHILYLFGQNFIPRYDPRKMLIFKKKMHFTCNQNVKETNLFMYIKEEIFGCGSRSFWQSPLISPTKKFEDKLLNKPRFWCYAWYMRMPVKSLRHQVPNHKFCGK